MSDGFITSASEYTGGGADFSHPAAAAEPVAQTEEQHHHQEAPAQGNEGDGEGIMVNNTILFVLLLSLLERTFFASQHELFCIDM